MAQILRYHIQKQHLAMCCSKLAEVEVEAGLELEVALEHAEHMFTLRDG